MRAGLLLLAALAASPAGARVVEFPMQLDHEFVRQRMVETLFAGPDESTRVLSDNRGCNDVVLSHPKLSGRDGKLHVVSDFDAKLGAGVGNWCLNATRQKGVLDAALEPRLHPTLPIVEFRVVGSDIYDVDGTQRFTGPLWDWVRSQVHPHLEALRIDLYQPISELRTFLPVIFPRSDFARVKQLLESVALSDVAIADDGIRVRVRLDVAPAPPSAAPPDEPALSPEELARWDESWQSWDGFLTFVVKHSAKDSADQRDQLRALLLDARHDLSEILASDQPRDTNPVKPLFLETWARLAPILRQLTTRLPGEAALHYLSLITAADAFTALEQLGPEYGVELTTNGLRRMARMIDPSPSADPTAYSEAVDPELRELFGFGEPLPLPEPEPEAEAEAAPEGAVLEDSEPLDDQADAAPEPVEATPIESEPSPPPGPDLAPERAPEPPLPQSYWPNGFELLLVASKPPRNLDGWVPSREELPVYLPQVAELLRATALRTQRKKVLAGQHAKLFRALVLTTAWQESCWRQFVRKKGAVQPLTSSVGALGIMQVNPHVWRGMYDVKSLRGNTKYNAEAGSEILHHYLVDYAIKKKEDQVRKKTEDLVRATYAAYNAGPRQLDRYRRSFPKGKTGHRIDADFWEKFQKIRDGNELAVKACFPGLAT